MKKIIIASDSFKGSLTSVQVAENIEEGVLSAYSDCHILKFPISDGGEGFVSSIVEAKKGSYKNILVNDPLMRPIKACYGLVENAETAVIEVAAASGLTLLHKDERNPMLTTTYGTGELIKDAILEGCKRIVLGVGGSATNDGGIGMLQALGYRFFDKKGKGLEQGGKILSEIHTIDDTSVLSQLEDVEFIVACDVDNPFYGEEGAAWTFATQKGASVQMMYELDKGLIHFANVIEKHTKIDVQKNKGSGAAGGLAGACLAFLNAKIVSGIDFVLDTIKFDKYLDGTDLVITGEGKMDVQTKRGKAALGVLKRAMSHKVPTIGITGNVENYQVLNEVGFLAVFSIIPHPISELEAMKPAVSSDNIRNLTHQVISLFFLN